MKIEKTKNTVRNVIFGYINKLIAVIFPFVIRTIMLYTLGTQYLGLGSLFSSILNVLNLAELGFGTAMVFSMYKPIASDDQQTINALLKLYRKVYQIIGTIVLVVGLSIMPALKYLIKGGYPADINLYILYAIYLAQTVIGYFFFAYRNSLLSAHQRNDVSSKINTIVMVATYGLQIGALLLFRNYYVYIIFLPISTLVINLFTAYRTKKMYPESFCEGELDKGTKQEIKKQIMALFTHRIGYVVQSSIDNISISAFVGLTTLGIYNNYMYIITAIQGFITIMFQSMVAGVGNSVITESVEHNRKLFSKLLLLNSWVIGWCSTCLMCLYQPFMKVWAGADNVFGIWIVVSLVFLFYATECRSVVGMYKDAMGMWRQDMFKPLVISLVNLAGTLLSLKFWRLEGVILSTALSYIIVGIPWETKVLYKEYFHIGKSQYYLKQLYYFAISAISVIGCYFICTSFTLSSVAQIAVNFAICLVVPNLIFALAYFKLPEFNLLKNNVIHIFEKIFRRKHD